MTGAGSNLILRVDEIQRNGSFPYFLLTDDDNHCKLTCRCKRSDNYKNERTSALGFAVVSV